MKLRVLVVDDEQPARRRLLDLIARRPDLELAGTSADGREAIDAILTRAPDLVLLDVQMPGGPRGRTARLGRRHDA